MTLTVGSKHYLYRVIDGWGRSEIVYDTVVKVNPKTIQWERHGSTTHEGYRGHKSRPTLRLATIEEVQEHKTTRALAILSKAAKEKIGVMVTNKEVAKLVEASRALGVEVPAWIENFVGVNP
jgi:hypothetical protein